MKSIFLSVVIICALAIAGIGGTFATWADSETSMDNRITTGSVDLKVNGEDDLEWGTGVPTKVTIDCMVPCKVYGPFEVDLWNAGVCEFDSHAYIHFKDMCCSNAPPKEGSGYPATYGTNVGDMKPEPELVAEAGGKVNCKTVPGIGELGDNCSMKSHVRVWVTGNPALKPDIDIPCGQDDRFLIDDKMINVECVESYLFDLTPCDERTIYLYFHLQQETEEMYNHNFFKHPEEIGLNLGTPEYAAALLEWKKFNDWPSWAMMRDVISFSIEFDLWLEDTPGAIVRPGG